MPHTKNPIKNILYIEDDEGLARLLQKRMQRFEYNVDIAPSGEEGLKKFRSGEYEILLVDNYLPGMSGIEVLKTLTLGEFDPPAIFLTSSGDERLALEALKLNAADYLIKDAAQTYLDFLPSVMTAAHTRVELLKQNKLQEQTLRDYAEKLRQSEKRLNMALVGSETGVWDWEIATGDLFWSENLRTSLGLPEEEKPSIQFWFDKIHPDDRPAVRQALNDHLAGKEKSYNVIYREKSSADSKREWDWILARGLAQFDASGKPYRVVGTSFDFTMHKQLEEQLEEQKNKAETANKTKSDFLATMSHEIRTPMNAIIGLADILSRTKIDAKQKEILNTMQNSSATLLSLINDLLDISRIEANQLMLEKLPMNLHNLVYEIKTMLSVTAGEKGLGFEVDTDGLKDIYFLGDKMRIRQILTNLCSNAIKFTDKGKILVSANYSRGKDDIYNIIIKVSDSGIGIPKEKLEAIFDKFVQADQSITRRFGGTGLGLAISHSLAEQMGGRIEVESTEGKGSTFILYLPLQHTKNISLAEKHPHHDIHKNADSNKPKVLLVEDYTPNVMVATLLLEDMGFEYEVANNGVEAVEKVQAAPGSFDIILMDVQMHAMDGFEATGEIRKLEQKHGWKPNKIIGLTAHALAGDRERCIKAGMDEYITKPINAEELEKKISNLLES